MEGILFSTEELEHRVHSLSETPPIGTQFWEMPGDRIAAAVLDHKNGTSSLFFLLTEEDFCNRPLGSLLVAFPKNKADFKPQRKPVTIQSQQPKQSKKPRQSKKTQHYTSSYRNLIEIFG